MTKRAPKQPLLYLWALGYKTPADNASGGDEQVREGEEEYAYYAPIRSLEGISLELQRWTDAQCRVNGRFLYMREPLSWQVLEAARLVPANLRTRLYLALAYDFYTCREVPMTWLKPPNNRLDEGGVMIAWYGDMKLWGARFFCAPTGRMGTTFAKTREPLAEASLRRGYIPSPTMLDRVLALPGMDAIRPVFIAQGNTAAEQTPLLTAILAHKVQGAIWRWLLRSLWLVST